MGFDLACLKLVITNSRESKYVVEWSASNRCMMGSLIQGLEDLAEAYLDDIVVFSETWEEHLQHVRQDTFGDDHLMGKCVKYSLSRWNASI